MHSGKQNEHVSTDNDSLGPYNSQLRLWRDALPDHARDVKHGELLVDLGETISVQEGIQKHRHYAQHYERCGRVSHHVP
jgi:hypothetical protein